MYDAHDDEYSPNFARIKVVGVGGGGGNAVNRMIEANVEGVEFVAVNTDAQMLVNSNAPITVRIGDKLTKGLGAGGRPEVGERAAEESQETLQEVLRGADMVFITAGMGGGTGSGASPIVAKMARETGALTVGVVTKPFDFEGAKRRRVADESIATLREHVDALITIPNQRLMQMVDPKTPFAEAFRIADDVLRQGIQGISDLIVKPGMINLDFADVKTIMRDAGSALMAIGRGTGDDRTAEAARMAIESPLLEMSIDGATGVLYNITASGDLSIAEVGEAAEIIRSAADDDAEIIFGTSIDESLGRDVTITLIATGFQGARPSRARSRDERERIVEPRDRGYDRERERERDRAVPGADRRSQRALDGGAPPRTPVLPDDEWSEPAILRFLRERQ